MDFALISPMKGSRAMRSHTLTHAFLTLMTLAACNTADSPEFDPSGPDDDDAGTIEESLNGGPTALDNPCTEGQLHAIQGTSITAPCPLGTDVRDTLGRLVDANFNIIKGAAGRSIMQGSTLRVPVNRAVIDHHSIDTLKEARAVAGAGLLGVQLSTDSLASSRTSYAVTEAQYFTDMVRYNENDLTYRTGDISPLAAYHIDQITEGTGCVLIHESQDTEIDLNVGINAGRGNTSPQRNGNDPTGGTNTTLDNYKPVCTPQGVQAANNTFTAIRGELSAAQNVNAAQQNESYINALLIDLERAREILALENACSAQGDNFNRPGLSVSKGFALNFSYYEKTGMIKTNVDCRGVDEPNVDFFFSATPDQVAAQFQASNVAFVTPQLCRYAPLPRFVCIDGDDKLERGDMVDVILEVRNVVINKAGEKKSGAGSKNKDRWKWNMTAETFIKDRSANVENIWPEPQSFEVNTRRVQIPTGFRYVMSNLPTNAPAEVRFGGTKEYVPHKQQKLKGTVTLPSLDVPIDPDAAEKNSDCDPNDNNDWATLSTQGQAGDSAYTIEVCYRNAFTEEQREGFEQDAASDDLPVN